MSYEDSVLDAVFLLVSFTLDRVTSELGRLGVISDLCYLDLMSIDLCRAFYSLRIHEYQYTRCIIILGKMVSGE